MSEGTEGRADIREQAATGPGHRLEAEREARGLERAAVAEALGVAIGVVEALESDDFERLGAPVYVRGYLRKYASYLGLSGDELVTAYEAVAAPHDPDVHAHATATLPRRANARWLAPVTAGILVVVLVLVGLWVWRRVREGVSPARRPPAAAVSAEMALTGAVPSSTTRAAKAPVAASSPHATAPASSPAAGSPAQVAGVGALRLALEINQPSWVEVYTAENKRLYYDLAPAGQTLSFSAAKGPLKVFLGNAAGVTVLVDGRDFSIPAGARSGNTARFEVTRASPPAAATKNGT